MSTQTEHVRETEQQVGAEKSAQVDKAPDAKPEGVYPPGLEPDLEGDELEAARRKERRYTWLVRIQLIMLLAIAALVLYFIFTS